MGLGLVMVFLVLVMQTVEDSRRAEWGTAQFALALIRHCLIRLVILSSPVLAGPDVKSSSSSSASDGYLLMESEYTVNFADERKRD